VVGTVLKDFHVDDCLKSVSSEDHAVALSRNCLTLYSSGGFCLTKSGWATTELSCHQSQMKNESLKSKTCASWREDSVYSCYESGTFKFQMHEQDKPITRRGILSVVSSVHDPLGFWQCSF
jgi:hypothetical protein